MVTDASRYDRMTYRRCGKSGPKLPTVSLGLWHNFGEVDDLSTARAIILRALDLGITHFDLANNYGPPPGSAEENFGKILRQDLAGHRDELVISTKAGYFMWPGPYGEWGSRKHLLASLDQSLRRLQLEYVDIFYSHRFDPETPLEETMGALAHAVHQGKALYVGISNYGVDQTRQAAALLEQMGVRCLIHQPKYNMLDRRAEEGLLATLEELGIGCIAFSPLGQGLLSDRYLHGIPPDARAAKPHGSLRPEQLTEETLAKVRRLDEIAKRRGQSLAQMVLAWVLRHPHMSSALVGASKVAQLEANVGALRNLQFSLEELKSIDRVLGCGA
ncbi:MAG: L-glyceraldehyde 3-phosphate reductase [bacterium]|jgi:L-glyceraldehyde 3-phosphate reductase|nr:L-glyceraldehyde 3-phosphate reductase [candidate division KSB1 bacterium]MDH7560499.1 L-glyceraldehyde 3-phosphate reductase [bacterium]